MPVRELITKILGFGIVAASLLAGGAFVFAGPHASNDYLNLLLGLSLIGLGGLTVAYGAFVILAIYFEGRRRRELEAVHVTPRSGPPSAPPPWGMGDVGRVDRIVEVGRDSGVRVMHVRAGNLDAVLVIGLLMAWTVIALLIFAPSIGK